MPREEIFRKFKKGTLRSGSGKKVKSRKQAIAIAMKYPKEHKGKHRAGSANPNPQFGKQAKHEFPVCKTCGNRHPED